MSLNKNDDIFWLFNDSDFASKILKIELSLTLGQMNLVDYPLN